MRGSCKFPVSGNPTTLSQKARDQGKKREVTASREEMVGVASKGRRSAGKVLIM